jgi:lysophospholipid acyltransferase (LPLAT)-like uncharacterized protein
MRINPVRFAPLITKLYSFWIRSLRYDHEALIAALAPFLEEGRPVMLAIFHEELFALTGFGLRYLHGRFATVASDSRDGELIAQVLERIGFLVARGSSTRGGLKALKQLRRYMEEGRIGVITVDGPRGPRRKPKEGAVYLSQRAGALLVPVRAHCDSVHVFQKTWDHFQVPMPFSRCRVLPGAPIAFSAEKLSAEELARKNNELERALLDLLPE